MSIFKKITKTKSGGNKMKSNSKPNEKASGKKSDSSFKERKKTAKEMLQQGFQEEIIFRLTGISTKDSK